MPNPGFLGEMTTTPAHTAPSGTRRLRPSGLAGFTGIACRQSSTAVTADGRIPVVVVEAQREAA